jgi:hypothetical protein
MAFKELKEDSYKGRILALLLGATNTGKSTLLAQLPAPIAVVDSDIRFDKVRKLVAGKVYAQVDNLADATDIDASLDWLKENMPGSNVATIVWDSITPVLEPIVNRAMDLAELTPEQRVAMGEPKNKAALWEPKARAMRKIISIQNYGTHCVWVAHYEPGRDNQGKESERKTIPQNEFDRFPKALNMRLRTICVKGRYGVVIEWLRDRPTHTETLWDPPGNMFKGMWERIMAVAEGAPAPGEPTKWEDFSESTPFPGPKRPDETPPAVTMAVTHFVEHDGIKFYPFGDPFAEKVKANGEPGTNGAEVHALHAYNKIKKGEHDTLPKPTSAGEMTKYWKQDVERRIQEAIHEYDKQKATQPESAELPGMPEPEVPVQESYF